MCGTDSWSGYVAPAEGGSAGHMKEPTKELKKEGMGALTDYHEMKSAKMAPSYIQLTRAGEDCAAQNKEEDLEYKVGQTEALIERLTATSGELETAIAHTEAEILQAQEAMAEALATRNEENEEFKAALKDDTDAVVLLASALDALTAYSKNNKLGLIAKHQQPEYSVYPDAAPSADFSGGSSHSSETGGITGIISRIKEDLENEIKGAKAAESAALAEFKKQRSAALATVAAPKEKKMNQEMQSGHRSGKVLLAKETFAAAKKLALLAVSMKRDSFTMVKETVQLLTDDLRA